LDIILQKTAAGAVGARYLRGLGIDEPWQRTDIGAANTNRVYLADALGSIVALADTNKVIQTEYDYEPFGTTTTTGTGNKNSYKFTAREDDATGLYYYRARYYHPALGRFVSEDPFGRGTGANLFAYVRSRPTDRRDPFGLRDVTTTGRYDYSWPGWRYAPPTGVPIASFGWTFLFQGTTYVRMPNGCVYRCNSVTTDVFGIGVGLGVPLGEGGPWEVSAGFSEYASVSTDFGGVSGNIGWGYPVGFGVPIVQNLALSYQVKCARVSPTGNNGCPCAETP
jgi:RHS repeat-associated protein